MNWILGKLEALSTFTGDLAWGFATSAPFLILLAAIAVAAFVVAHVPLVERFFPEVIPYTKAALIAQLVASTALIFLLGFSVAHDRDETEQLKNDLAWSEFQLEQQRAVADAADELKRQADAEASEAKGKLNEYQSRFGDNPASVCVAPPGYLEWLRTLQRHAARTASADKPQPGLVARLRTFGGQRR